MIDSPILNIPRVGFGSKLGLDLGAPLKPEPCLFSPLGFHLRPHLEHLAVEFLQIFWFSWPIAPKISIRSICPFEVFTGCAKMTTIDNNCPATVPPAAVEALRWPLGPVLSRKKPRSKASHVQSPRMSIKNPSTTCFWTSMAKPSVSRSTWEAHTIQT